jgi:alcohol dehydrogenase class IV
MTLGALLRVNSDIDGDNCQDPRGPDHVRAVVGDICEAVGYTNPHRAADALENLLAELPIPSRLGDFGVNSRSDRLRIAKAVNLERLGNNPRVLGLDDLCSVLEKAG